MGVREVFDRHARLYDRSRRVLIPCFDEFYGAAVSALELDPHPEAQPAILDLGAGTGLLSLFVLEAYPRARLTLLDLSAEMLELARERFADHAQVPRRVVADYSEAPLPGGTQAVVSALSIHHLSDSRKVDLFENIYAALEPGGIFVNADQVSGPTREIDRELHAQWLAAVRANGITEQDLEAALERMKEDDPSPVTSQLEWLEQAGFGACECHFESAIFAVFSARKPR